MPDDDDDVLIPRAETRRILHCGKEKVRELEDTGKLRKVRLSTSPKGRVMHIRRDVKALMVPETVSPGPAVPVQRAKLRARP